MAGGSPSRAARNRRCCAFSSRWGASRAFKAPPSRRGLLDKEDAAAWREALGILYGLKNRVINGNFAVNQRAVSGTVALSAGEYGHDRWKAGASGCTYTFETVENVTTLTITAGSLQQVIEGENLMSGTHTLSWTGTAQGKIGAGSFDDSGVTGSVTGGTDLTVEFGTGTLSLVQLEEGETATPYAHRPIGLELALCQRYYLAGVAGRSISSTGGHASSSVRFPVWMRDAPTVTHDIGSGFSPAVTVRRDGFFVRVSSAGADNAAVAEFFSWTADAEL